eukprot:scaffold6568_cov126-Isochrysis_galbana.AAC.4
MRAVPDGEGSAAADGAVLGQYEGHRAGEHKGVGHGRNQQRVGYVTAGVAHVCKHRQELVQAQCGLSSALCGYSGRGTARSPPTARRPRPSHSRCERWQHVPRPRVQPVLGLLGAPLQRIGSSSQGSSEDGHPPAHPAERGVQASAREEEGGAGVAPQKMFAELGGPERQREREGRVFAATGRG